MLNKDLEGAIRLGLMKVRLAAPESSAVDPQALSRRKKKNLVIAGVMVGVADVAISCMRMEQPRQAEEAQQLLLRFHPEMVKNSPQNLSSRVVNLTGLGSSSEEMISKLGLKGDLFLGMFTPEQLKELLDHPPQDQALRRLILVADFSDGGDQFLFVETTGGVFEPSGIVKQGQDIKNGVSVLGWATAPTRESGQMTFNFWNINTRQWLLGKYSVGQGENDSAQAAAPMETPTSQPTQTSEPTSTKTKAPTPSRTSTKSPTRVPTKAPMPKATATGQHFEIPQASKPRVPASERLNNFENQWANPENPYGNVGGSFIGVEAAGNTLRVKIADQQGNVQVFEVVVGSGTPVKFYELPSTQKDKSIRWGNSWQMVDAAQAAFTVRTYFKQGDFIMFAHAIKGDAPFGFGSQIAW